MSTTTTPITSITSTRIRRVVAASAMAVLVGATLFGCSTKSGSPDAQATTTTSVAADQTTTAAAQGSSSGQATSSGQSSSGQSSSGQSSTGGQSSSPAPMITSFTTPDNIDCHNGNFQTFSASWTTTNADKVTISIDGPGVYDTYPANGDTSLPFNCSSSHSFLLTAYGSNGQTATKTVTLDPRNVVPPDNGTQNP